MKTHPPLELKERLVHTWSPFLGRFGNFTPIQLQAIPPILQGQDTLVIAATASGKTEAVVAPLLERLLQKGPIEPGLLRILYICPTRALVRDLVERLQTPLENLGISLALKTGDTGPVAAANPATLLITTPESTDSLLTRIPRLFIPLQAIVLDEIHLFDRTPRGDHLRCLLNRIERIRTYAQSDTRPAQRIALSATVPDPDGVAARYLHNGVVAKDGRGRTLNATLSPLHGLADLTTALATRPAHKSLLFCNTRNEVEQVAAYLRQHLPYQADIFTHYSNLDKEVRQDVETRFAAATVALCVSSSTLELGIDIGTIDEVVLIGPPPTLTSFLQRIGRGGRRTGETRVLCLARSPLEEIRFLALLGLAQGKIEAVDAAAYHFRPAVLIQQTFSLLKQSPTGSLRLADLRRIAPPDVPDEWLPPILRNLAAEGYLQSGRPGEWRPGPKLNPLIDEHEIYSNIGGENLKATVLDAYSGRKIAQTQTLRQKGETLLMGGRPVQVSWQDKYQFAVEKGQREAVEEILRFRTAPFAVPLEVAQGIAAALQLPPGLILTLPEDDGTWLFHFWGDIYGELLAAMLQAHYPATDWQPRIRVWNEVALHLPFHLEQLPTWDGRLARRELGFLARRIEEEMDCGRFHPLLPPDLAVETVVALCDLERFEKVYRAAAVSLPPIPSDRLLALL